jgi:hypothetical protein
VAAPAEAPRASARLRLAASYAASPHFGALLYGHSACLALTLLATRHAPTQAALHAAIHAALLALLAATWPFRRVDARLPLALGVRSCSGSGSGKRPAVTAAAASWRMPCARGGCSAPCHAASHVRMRDALNWAALSVPAVQLVNLAAALAGATTGPAAPVTDVFLLGLNVCAMALPLAVCFAAGVADAAAARRLERMGAAHAHKREQQQQQSSGDEQKAEPKVVGTGEQQHPPAAEQRAASPPPSPPAALPRAPPPHSMPLPSQRMQAAQLVSAVAMRWLGTPRSRSRRFSACSLPDADADDDDAFLSEVLPENAPGGGDADAYTRASALAMTRDDAGSEASRFSLLMAEASRDDVVTPLVLSRPTTTTASAARPPQPLSRQGSQGRNGGLSGYAPLASNITPAATRPNSVDAAPRGEGGTPALGSQRRADDGPAHGYAPLASSITPTVTRPNTSDVAPRSEGTPALGSRRDGTAHASAPLASSITPTLTRQNTAEALPARGEGTPALGSRRADGAAHAHAQLPPGDALRAGTPAAPAAADGADCGGAAVVGGLTSLGTQRQNSRRRALVGTSDDVRAGVAPLLLHAAGAEASDDAHAADMDEEAEEDAPASVWALVRGAVAAARATAPPAASSAEEVAHALAAAGARCAALRAAGRHDAAHALARAAEAACRACLARLQADAMMQHADAEARMAELERAFRTHGFEAWLLSEALVQHGVLRESAPSSSASAASQQRRGGDDDGGVSAAAAGAAALGALLAVALGLGLGGSLLGR